MVGHNLAIAFPGQGIQKPGMATSIRDTSAWSLFEKANKILGYDLGELCLQGPAETLSDTKHAQVAIFVTCLALWELNKKSIRPKIFLGHSLGEITALAAAGALSFEDGVRLVKARGEIMSQGVTGGMMAILGLDVNTVHELCQKVAGQSYVQVANENSPIQTVISGELLGLELVATLAKEQGAKRTVMLNVSGPFHSKLMEDAALQFAEIVEPLELQSCHTPVLSNDGTTFLREPHEIKAKLVSQLTSSVRFTKSVQKLVELGIEEFVEISPERLLIPLARRIEAELKFSLVTDGGI